MIPILHFLEFLLPRRTRQLVHTPRTDQPHTLLAKPADVGGITEGLDMDNVLAMTACECVALAVIDQTLRSRRPTVISMRRANDSRLPAGITHSYCSSKIACQPSSCVAEACSDLKPKPLLAVAGYTNSLPGAATQR